MSMEKVATDKIRFFDDATEFNFDPNTPFIHTIELSDDRSQGNFISFYITGLSAWARDMVEKWKPRIHTHRGEFYHAEGQDRQWVIDHFGADKATPSWAEH